MGWSHFSFDQNMLRATFTRGKDIFARELVLMSQSWISCRLRWCESVVNAFGHFGFAIRWQYLCVVEEVHWNISHPIEARVIRNVLPRCVVEEGYIFESVKSEHSIFNPECQCNERMVLKVLTNILKLIQYVNIGFLQYL